MKRTVGWIAVCIALLLSSCTAQEEVPAAPIDPKGEGVLSWEAFTAAPEGERVVLETYVQAAEVWWNGVCAIYTQDRDGAYFLPDAACSMAEAEQLIPGTKLRVTGTKAIRSGMPCVAGAQFELLLPPKEADPAEGAKPAGTGAAEAGTPDPAYFYIPDPLDITDLIGKEDQQEALAAHLGKYVELRGVSILGAARFKEDGSGADGNDLFFEGTAGGDGQPAELRFQVCSYLLGSGTEAYEAVKALQGGETVDLKGFLFCDGEFVLRVTAIEKSE